LKQNKGKNEGKNEGKDEGHKMYQDVPRRWQMVKRVKTCQEMSKVERLHRFRSKCINIIQHLLIICWSIWSDLKIIDFSEMPRHCCNQEQIAPLSSQP
jgi:hypothetical protein